MKQTQKLNALISRIIKEELEESDYMFISKNDPKKMQKKTAASQAGMAVVEDDPTDASSNKLKTSEAEEMQEPEMEQQQPTGTEIAGQVAEIVEKLKSMSEGSKDPKKQKLAAKAMKQMESAKAALEALTSHETMLEEKDQAEQEKKAEKHKKSVEKIFKGIVKDENIVNRLKDKLSTKDIAALSKKLGEKGKELDEEKLARIVLNRSLKEGWMKKSSADSKVKGQLGEISKFVSNFHSKVNKMKDDKSKGV
jgi:hypothetical protein